jgi:glycosyltransferase involved in cell wall biosynthesis
VARVLLVHQPIDGGVARHVSDLAAGLPAHGLEVFTAGPAPAQPAADPERHVRLNLQRAIAGRADLQSLHEFGRIVDALRPDLIHAHSSKAGAVARLARLRRRGPPVIYTPHGYAFAGFFSRPAERVAYRGVERMLSPLASRVLAVCQAEAGLAAAIGPRRRVRVVHNGIPATGSVAPDPQMAQLSRHRPVIATLTLLRPGKGIETLIDAAPAVLARHPTAQLAIWGEGPDAQTLTARARRRGVASAVNFLGPTPRPLSALAPATVFVLPSWAESFPYVVLEAMSLGLATVASDVGGVSEAIEHGRDGLLVPPRDPAALAAALGRLLEDDRERTALGRAASDRIQREFSLERMLEGVAAVYREVLPGR